MGSNCNGVEVGLNKYPMAWNLPSLYSVQLGCITPQKKDSRNQSHATDLNREANYLIGEEFIQTIFDNYSFKVWRITDFLNVLL